MITSTIMFLVASLLNGKGRYSISFGSWRDSKYAATDFGMTWSTPVKYAGYLFVDMVIYNSRSYPASGATRTFDFGVEGMYPTT